MYILYAIYLEITIFTLSITFGESLRCRTDDGPSDGELKRVARSCMRKFGDMAFVQNSQQQQQQQQQSSYNQQHQQSQGSYNRQPGNNKANRGYHYEDSEENDNYDFDDEQFYNNNRNYNRQHYGNNNNNRNGHNANNNNNNNNGVHNDDRQHQHQRYNNNNQNRTHHENHNNYWNYSNQRIANREYNSNNNNYNGNRNKNQNNQNNNDSSDVNCIVHCFFNEMHMLNNDDYPDRHKMLYVLTKDIRDRELRNFYSDTIQECFRYLENQRRRDKCQFSRDLIACMTEYAKGNCDDWNEFNMMFN